METNQNPMRLSIIEYAVHELHLAAGLGTDDEATLVHSEPSVDFEFFIPSDTPRAEQFALKLEVKNAGDAAAPLSYSTVLIAMFTLSPHLEGTDMPMNVAVNALTMLYGVARGVLLSAAGPFRNRSILLPSVYFGSMVEERYRRQKLERERPAAPPNKSPRRPARSAKSSKTK